MMLQVDDDEALDKMLQRRAVKAGVVASTPTPAPVTPVSAVAPSNETMQHMHATLLAMSEAAHAIKASIQTPAPIPTPVVAAKPAKRQLQAVIHRDAKTGKMSGITVNIEEQE